MKRLIPILFVFATAVFADAEEVTLKQSAVLKSDRSMVSLKAGTVVELVSKDADTATVKYGKVTGTIPASKLAEPKPAAAPKPAEDKANPPPANPPPANPPQSGYGKAVQKAKDNAAAHDKNVAKPADEILK